MNYKPKLIIGRAEEIAKRASLLRNPVPASIQDIIIGKPYKVKIINYKIK